MGARMIAQGIILFAQDHRRLPNTFSDQVVEDPADDRLAIDRHHGIGLVGADRQARVIDRATAEDDGGFALHVRRLITR